MMVTVLKLLEGHDIVVIGEVEIRVIFIDEGGRDAAFEIRSPGPVPVTRTVLSMQDSIFSKITVGQDDNQATVTLLKIDRNQVKLAIDAQRHVSIKKPKKNSERTQG